MASAHAYDAISLKGVASNYYGFYSLKLPVGKVRISFSYTGYSTIVEEFILQKDTVIKVQLNPIVELEEIVVTSHSNIILESQVGAIRMTPIQVKQFPVLGGEIDILKTLQLTPGIKGGVEGTSGMYVRGGGADQNFILIDGVPVYYASHLFGFFSVFNTDAIQNFTMYKGSFPARFGGRLSSVLDIKMKEGNMKEVQGNLSVSLISSSLTLEGPIVLNRSSFIISARRTYIEPFVYIFREITNSESNGGYYFYDINAKVNHKFTEKTRLYFSLYNGFDKLHFSDKSKRDTLTNQFNTASGWGNLAGALRLNHVVNNDLFCNITATMSNYSFFVFYDNFGNNIVKNRLKYESGILDFGGKIDFDYISSPNHYIRFGGSYTRHKFNPGEQKIIAVSLDTSFINEPIFSNELFFYAENEQKVLPQLGLSYGFSLSHYVVNRTSYTIVQPRFSLCYSLSAKLSAKLAVSKMVQNVHLISSSNIQYPTDLWVPVNETIKPANAWNYSAGLTLKIENDYEMSLEGYYKPMSNLIEYKEGSSFINFNQKWEEKVEIGKGVGKGIELFVNKTSGKLTGWVGYTLSYSSRQFPNINLGKSFPDKYDRRHDVSVVATYKLSKSIDMGFVWVYATGNAITLADEKIAGLHGVNSQNPLFFTVDYFSGRNAYRMPSSHRLDVSFNFHKTLKWGVRTLSCGLYNAYNRFNPMFLVWEHGSNAEDKKLMQYSIFPAIPFVNYAIKF